MGIKKVILGFATAATLGGGTLVTDEVINPYTDKGTKLEIVAESTLQDAGMNRVELSKTEPAVTLGKWNDEVALTVRYDKVQVEGQRAFLTDRMEWKGAKEEVHAYPLEAKAGMEDGGFEIEVVLNEKPNTNAFEFQIEGAENLDFFYQPELTLEEIAEGAERPENVVGSYAVYHKTKANHRVGSTNYATGKAYHIYRPKAFDAGGAETWAELSYTNGVLSVTVPQKFLDDATYPVRVDPTFGYTTLGASDASPICGQGSDTSSTVGKSDDSTYVLSQDGNVTQMSLGLRSSSGTETADTFAVIYREDSAAADSHGTVASAETLDLSVTATAAFYDFSFASELLTADTYVLAGLCDGVDVAGVAVNINTRSDSGTGLRFYIESSTGAGGYATRKAENPWTEVDSASSVIQSFYVTYTASAATVIDPRLIIQGTTIINATTILNQ